MKACPKQQLKKIVASRFAYEKMLKFLRLKTSLNLNKNYKRLMLKKFL